jgi:hypothetical protein
MSIFRAGIEGRISVLFRGRGMKRCLAEGRKRFELWVATAVLANNLMKIAALLAERSSRTTLTAKPQGACHRLAGIGFVGEVDPFGTLRQIVLGGIAKSI